MRFRPPANPFVEAAAWLVAVVLWAGLITVALFGLLP
jgi:hypothetical protein